MNFQFYLEKLFASEHFEKFMKESPDAYPCSGFFKIDKEGKENKQHFDYFVPSIKKMFSFQLESGCEKIPIDLVDEKIPEKISANYNFEFKDVEKLIEDKMNEEKISNKLQKVLLSLQHLDGKDYFIGTVFLSGFGMLKVNIEISEMKITEFEKKSFFEMLKISGKKKEEEN